MDARFPAELERMIRDDIRELLEENPYGVRGDNLWDALIEHLRRKGEAMRRAASVMCG